ncbi:MAG: hypothetical protein ACREPT_00385 [Rudaea sp.]
MPVRVENLDAITRELSRVSALRDGGDQAIARAVGTLKRRLPAQAKRDIAGQYALASSKIGSGLRCKGDDSSITLTAVGRTQTLTRFPSRQTRTGVQAEIQKGSPVEIAHAFIRTPTGSASTSGPQAFIRDAVAGALPADVDFGAVIDHDRHGYPLVMLTGPSVADMLRNGDREDRLIDFAQTVFAAEVDRQLELANG